MGELLAQYAAKQTFPVRPGKGAVKISCEDDLWRHYARDPYWMAHYLMEDNATCTRPIPPGAALGPPGWGGSYRGSKARCAASHDQRSFAQPDVCLPRYGKPAHQPGTSFASFDEFPTPSEQDPFDWAQGRWKSRAEMDAMRRRLQIQST